MGHTGAALGGEPCGNHEHHYCFRRPLVIDRSFWRNEFAVPNRRDPSLHTGFWGHLTTDRTGLEGIGPTPAQPPTLELGEFAPADPSARAAVVASLAGTLSRAVALGDAEAARVVHEAIGQLLGLPVAPEG